MARKNQEVTTGITALKKARSPSQPTGTWITKERRLAIYLRDRFTCLLCLKDLHDADPRDVTLDHVTPKVDGGSNESSNLYTACRSCNCSRQDKPLNRVAGPETVAHVRRNVRRSMVKPLKLAKALVAGKVGFEETFKQV